MKHTIILILMLVMVTIAGCEKRLEVTPSYQSTEDMALSTVDGMDAALSASYAFMYGGSGIGTSFTLWSDMMSDHLTYTGAVQNLRNFYERNLIAAADETNANGTYVATGVFGNFYRTVNYASLVIRGIDLGYANSDVAFAANKNRLLGESYFIRGVMYFYVARAYAKQWGATSDNAHPGIVINSGPVEDRESQIKKRATLAETYAFIIENLLKAESLLPQQYNPAIHPPIYAGRTYKDAATAFLARVYFQQRDYVRAKDAIDRLIGAVPGTLSSHSLEEDMTKLFTSRGPEQTLPENIMQLTVSGTINSSSGVAFFGQNQGIYAASPTARASSNFIEDAHYYSNDPRFTLLLKKISTGYAPNKYSLTQYANMPIIRTAEMLLDRAEINAMNAVATSDVQAKANAIADCNLIRDRAYGTDAAARRLPSTIGAQALMDSIKVERIRELAFEGDRLWNLKRMGVSIPGGERPGAVPLSWNGNELVFKFNFQDMTTNPLLENNL